MADLTDLTRFTSGSIADRQARLPGPLRGLYRAVLRRFLATGAPPTAQWVRQAAAETGLDASALDDLSAADAVHVVNGVVAVAYPFSGTPPRTGSHWTACPPCTRCARSTRSACPPWPAGTAGSPPPTRPTAPPSR